MGASWVWGFAIRVVTYFPSEVVLIVFRKYKGDDISFA